MKKIILFIAFIFSGVGMYAQNSYNSFGSYTNNTEPVKITIYPNPSADYIQIQDKDNIVSTAVLYNLAGRKIRTFETEGGNSLNISDLPKGMYLMQFLDSKDKLVGTQRLSKK
ncbi:MAG TPA: T9SS type A sorting domain-containing protein [Saprospiraceae bacterium]|nr:T9SS type A sorting domain-containing protein [Saprospiraceae bacterium]